MGWPLLYMMGDLRRTLLDTGWQAPTSSCTIPLCSVLICIKCNRLLVRSYPDDGEIVFETHHFSQLTDLLSNSAECKRIDAES